MTWITSPEGRLVFAAGLAAVLWLVRRWTAWQHVDWRAELGALAGIAIGPVVAALLSGAEWHDAILTLATSVLVAAGWQSTKTQQEKPDA